MENGGIYKKSLHGKTVYTMQYRENGKMVTRSLAEGKAYREAFELFHKKEGSLEALRNHEFRSQVVYGEGLYLLSKNSKLLKKRGVFADLQDYLQGSYPGKVLTLYGLRRTGKTTLMMQAIAEMPLKEFPKAAYIKIGAEDSMSSLSRDMDFLVSCGFRYFFLDEVTLLEGFIRAGSMFSDIYAMMGKVVLSGTDSLGFAFASHHELYDRVITLHTSFISYPEWARVFDNDSFNDYIAQGGTMSKEGLDYNRRIVRGKKEYNEYVDTAIAHNITHSLRLYQDGDHFGSLYPIFEAGELPNLINRVVEDTNHRFVLSVIDRAFKSHDLGSLKDLLNQKSVSPIARDALSEVSDEQVSEALKKALSILDKRERTVDVSPEALLELESYLDLLDVSKQIDVMSFATKQITKKRTFLPLGLRYAQAKELLRILKEQEPVKELPLEIQRFIEAKLLSDIKGRMLEEIVLYQSAALDPDNQYFKLNFPAGEFDMVRIDNKEMVADIFEIKYSQTPDVRQAKYLTDPELCNAFEKAFCPIRGRYVIYRGKDITGTVMHLNVLGYLAGLKRDTSN